MTSPVSKDDQFIHILKRLAHRQRNKRRMEEEEVVFVKKKKKKAKKNTHVIILDKSNSKLKEEAIDYVKNEVIDNKDLIRGCSFIT